MDANVNLISSALPDLSTRSEKPSLDLKSNKETSFNSVLDKAQKATKAPEKNKKESVPTEISRDYASEQQPMKAVKLSQKEETSSPMKEEEKPVIDDRAGVIAQSYDGTAVSYPVSKIAKESLDEKTVTKLKDAGLWDLPTLTMAQPSQQLLMMKDFAANVDEEDIMPVAKPIAQFMASLENELGIKPDRLVEAFQKLPPGQLQEPPVKTMAQVVKNLNLNAKDEAKASALFTKMLSQMQSATDESVNPALLATIAGNSVGATQLSEKVVEGGVAKDTKSLAKGKVQVATSRYVQNTGLEKVVPGQSKAVTVDGIEKDPQLQKVMGKENFQKEVSSETPAQKGAFEVPPAMTEVQNQVIPPQTVPNQVVANQAVQANPTQTPEAFTVPNKFEDKTVKEISKGVKSSKESLTVKGAPQAQTGPSSLAAQETPLAKPDVAGSAVVGGGVANAELKAGEDTKHEAIRNIVNQAQMLAQKGGGEIRMTLKPDHLGEIQLKVAMEGNRVNVSMTAERGEVKKLIEQSVHELRHGLASHNLSMDKLDVSVGNRDMGSFKGQPDFGAAKDFANQFHQQQNNRREMMEDLSSIRGNALKSMTAMDRSSQVQKTLGARNSGRLNVVA